MSWNPLGFNRETYLSCAELFEAQEPYDPTEEACEFNEDVDDACVDLAYLRYHYAKAEQRIQELEAQLKEREWVSVDGYENMPEGKWLVKPEKEICGRDCYTAEIAKCMSIIATNFAFDMPKVVAYMPLPPSPKEDV